MVTSLPAEKDKSKLEFLKKNLTLISMKPVQLSEMSGLANIIFFV